jgi:2'-5' RNA ligase
MSFWKHAWELQLRIAGAYNPDEDYTGQYMTAFYFEDDHGIPYCHCTHKYFGELDADTVPKVIEAVDQYFSGVPDLKKDRTWVFDTFVLFGPEKDTPVMERMTKDDMFPDLKEQLEVFRTDNFPTYRPHVTLGEKVQDLSVDSLRPLKMKPVSYALVTGDQKVKVWNLV